MTPRRILLLPICGLGDAVCFAPYLRVIRAKFPKAEIVVVVATASAAMILKDNVENIEVIVFNRSEEKHPRRTLFRLLWAIRQRRFDVVISGAHPDSARVPVFAFLSGAGVRIGSKLERLSFFYNRQVDVPTDAHYVERYGALLTGLGIEMSPDGFSDQLQLPRDSEQAAQRLWREAGLADAELVIGVVSGADANVRGQWKPYLKRWNNESYADVVKWAYQEMGARIVMVGSASEAVFAENIAAISGVPIVNLCGRTGMRELQWILHKCAAVVSNDTGTMHLSGALGTRVLSLFGPTSPRSFRPPGAQNIVIEGHAPCSPCYPFPTCDLTTCQAMNNISPIQVIDGLKILLNAGSNVPENADHLRGV